MTCPNCRRETHCYDRHLVCSASCGWSQDAPRVEPRRPQVTDYLEVLRDTHWRLLFVNSATTSQPGADLPEFFTATDMYSTTERLYVTDEGKTWRWPATQGAAAAGPAVPVDVRPMAVVVNDAAGTRVLCTVSGVTLGDDSWDLEDQATKAEPAVRMMDKACPEHAHYWFHGHRGQHGFAPPPRPTSPPRSYSPTCAGTCWPPCVHHGTEVAIFMREDRNRLLVQNADLTAAKAALEVQLRDEASAAMDMIQDWSGKWCDMRDERDALAAQLKAMREALTEAADRLSAAADVFDGRDLPLQRDALEEAAQAARAALAASGPVKEGA